MRKTREQSRLETRQRLISSAHAAIVRNGIGGLSLRGLCEDAGYSQGSFYSNFSTRDDLLLTVMEEYVHDEVKALRHLVHSTRGKALDEVLATLALRLAELAKEPQWSMMAVELQLHAQRDARFADIYNAAKTGYHTEFALLVDEIAQGHGLVPIMEPLQIAIGLYALWSGLAVQGTVPGAQSRNEIFLAFLRAVIGVVPQDGVLPDFVALGNAGGPVG